MAAVIYAMMALLFFGCTSKALAEVPEELAYGPGGTSSTVNKRALYAGEVVTLSFAPDSSLTVSKRGVVELAPLGGEDWSLVALKKGVAIISERAPNGDERSRLVVEVETKTNRARDVNPFLSDDVTAFLCHEPGVRCDKKRFRVSGITHSWSWLQEARKLCAASGSCRFEVTPSPQAMAEGSRRWQRALGPWFRLTLTPEGQAVAAGDCRRADQATLSRLADHLTAGDVSAGRLHVICRAPFERSTFLLRARVFHLTDQESREFGLTYPRLAGEGRGDWLPDVHAFLGRHKTRVIGEPVMRLVAGEEGRVSGGSEVAYVVGRENPEQKWKKVGLEIRATAWPVSPSATEISFSVNLTHPTEGADGRVLDASELASQTVLVNAVPTIVGELDADAHVNDRQAVAGLERVPIIGPWFRFFANSHSKTRLFVWFVIDRDDQESNGASPGSWPASPALGPLAAPLDRPSPE